MNEDMVNERENSDFNKENNELFYDDPNLDCPYNTSPSHEMTSNVLHLRSTSKALNSSHSISRPSCPPDNKSITLATNSSEYGQLDATTIGEESMISAHSIYVTPMT